MKQYIGNISFLVRDYDEAINYFTQVLKFELKEDLKMTETKRWVRVAPPGDTKICLLLAKAKNEEEKSRIGNQTGGRVFLFLFTDDFWRDYEFMKSQDVEFIGEPRNEDYGTVIVFKDLYGNKWDFIQRKTS